MPEQPGQRVAYLHFGTQSGVTAHVAAALELRGHGVEALLVPGPLEPRDPRTGRLRLTAPLLGALACSALRFGRRALEHRWNTGFAFDFHSRRAGRLLAGLARRPDAVLQNGALFAPGLPPQRDYTLLLDHTRALSMQLPALPDAGLEAPLDYGPGWSRRETELYRGARTIATFSKRVAESLQADYGVAPERIHVVGAGANVHPDRIERRDDGRTLVFAGKDFRRKGGLVLVRAFERVRRQCPDVRLVVAGPRENLSLPQGAEQAGLVPLNRMEDLLARGTVFVMPTLREPFGLAFLDAMACGLPCVGTAVGAVPEIIEHGVTGLLVARDDDAGLAEALLQILNDAGRGRAMGLRGRLKVDATFLWSHVAERLERALFPSPLPLAACGVA